MRGNAYHLVMISASSGWLVPGVLVSLENWKWLSNEPENIWIPLPNDIGGCLSNEDQCPWKETKGKVQVKTPTHNYLNLNGTNVAPNQLETDCSSSQMSCHPFRFNDNERLTFYCWRICSSCAREGKDSNLIILVFCGGGLKPG
jgi:hypothetical protein